MRHYYTPGISITVVEGGKIAWSGGFGYRNTRTRKKAGADTMFLSGSVSKPVFSLAVVKLAESGRIDLDRDVNEYLKRWKIPSSGGWQPRVTLRQLLSHTAGTTVQGFAGYERSGPVPDAVKILKGLPPSNTGPVVVNILPGTVMRYSGGGVTIAQTAVEDAIGAPFARIMDEVLFKPLGLKNSTYDQTLPSKRGKQISYGYPYYRQEVKGGYHLYPEMAAAGLWSTGPDLAVLMIEVQKALGGEPSFFSKKSIASMLAPQRIAKNIGFGFFLEGEGAAERFYHNGWDEGFVSKFVSYKRGGNGAVLLLNSNAGFPMIDEVLRSIALEYGWTDYLPKKSKAVDLGPGAFRKYCGTYKSEAGLRFTIEAGGKGLKLQFEEQPTVKIVPESEKSFFSAALNLKVQFELGRSGRVKELCVVQGASTIKAEKQAA